MTTERWATRQDVADHLGVSIARVDQLVREGMPSVVLPSSNGGERKHRRFRLSEVDGWLEEEAKEV